MLVVIVFVLQRTLGDGALSTALRASTPCLSSGESGAYLPDASFSLSERTCLRHSCTFYSHLAHSTHDPAHASSGDIGNTGRQGVSMNTRNPRGQSGKHILICIALPLKKENWLVTRLWLRARHTRASAQTWTWSFSTATVSGSFSMSSSSLCLRCAASAAIWRCHIFISPMMSVAWLRAHANTRTCRERRDRGLVREGNEQGAVHLKLLNSRRRCSGAHSVLRCATH